MMFTERACASAVAAQNALSVSAPYPRDVGGCLLLAWVRTIGQTGNEPRPVARVHDPINGDWTELAHFLRAPGQVGLALWYVLASGPGVPTVTAEMAGPTNAPSIRLESFDPQGAGVAVDQTITGVTDNPDPQTVTVIDAPTPGSTPQRDGSLVVIATSYPLSAFASQSQPAYLPAGPDTTRGRTTPPMVRFWIQGARAPVADAITWSYATTPVGIIAAFSLLGS